jgi:aspartate/methionine/tyrosine aminotransferase
MRYRRMPIEMESPEELGYGTIANNLAESSFGDQRLADLGVDGDVGKLLLQYGDHKGLPELRELIARDGVGPDDVLVTAGAAPALFLVATTLLDPGSHALVCRPNYATNVETPRAIGADVEYVDLRFEDGWRLDPERIAAGLRPDTRLVSVCVPHNPTGRTIDESTLHELVALVERHGIARLLVDETYREIAYAPPLPLAASLSDRALGVASVSKAYGLPGLRIGWITCRDPAFAEQLLAAKEQVLLAGSLLDETMAARVLARRDAVLPAMLATMRRRRAAVVRWMGDQDRLEWHPPEAGVVCFPRLRAGLDVEAFYAALQADGTYVGPGHWFEQDRRHFRLGFGWPDDDELARGLASIAAAAEAAAG